jgi:hypothetical protein
VEAGNAGHGAEGPLGKERDGLALFDRAQDAPRVTRALVPVAALDEVVAEAAQQQAGERDARGFLLDDEPETRRQAGEKQRSVHVTGVVRDDDAGARVGKARMGTAATVSSGTSSSQAQRPHARRNGFRFIGANGPVAIGTVNWFRLC